MVYTGQTNMQQHAGALIFKLRLFKACTDARRPVVLTAAVCSLYSRVGFQQETVPV